MAIFGKSNYKVTINGTNFLTKIDSVVQNRGFYAPRIVQAKNETQAREAAMNMILGDEKLLSTIIRDESLNPELHVEKIEKIRNNNTAPENTDEVNGTYMFYEMETNVDS